MKALDFPTLPEKTMKELEKDIEELAKTLDSLCSTQTQRTFAEIQAGMAIALTSSPNLAHQVYFRLYCLIHHLYQKTKQTSFSA